MMLSKTAFTEVILIVLFIFHSFLSKKLQTKTKQTKQLIDYEQCITEITTSC